MTDNATMDFLSYDARQEKRIRNLPVCSECGNIIQQEFAVCIAGDWFCDDCLEGFRKEVPDD